MPTSARTVPVIVKLQYSDHVLPSYFRICWSLSGQVEVNRRLVNPITGMSERWWRSHIKHRYEYY